MASHQSITKCGSYGRPTVLCRLTFIQQLLIYRVHQTYVYHVIL